MMQNLRTNRFAHWTRSIAAATTILIVAACGGGDDDDDDGGTGPGNGIAGRYSIVEVNNDNSAPFVALEGTEDGHTFKIEIVDGQLDLDADGSYSSEGSMRITFDGQTQTDESSESGSYTVSGNTVTFNPAGNDSEDPNFTATRNGNSLTMTQTDAELGIELRIVARRQ